MPSVKKIDDGAFEALKAKNPGAVLVPTRAGDAVFSIPSADDFAEFMRDMKAGHGEDATDRLVRGACVAPSGEELDAMIERKPGIIGPCASAILEAAGLDGNASYAFDDADDHVTVETCIGSVKLRCPSRTERKQYRAGIEEKSTANAALTRYVSACVVSHSSAEFAAAVASRPGLIGTCFGPLQELAGGEVLEHVKK